MWQRKEMSARDPATKRQKGLFRKPYRVFMLSGPLFYQGVTWLHCACLHKILAEKRSSILCMIVNGEMTGKFSSPKGDWFDCTCFSHNRCRGFKGQRHPVSWSCGERASRKVRFMGISLLPLVHHGTSYNSILFGIFVGLAAIDVRVW